jgi:hypothetical protein
VSLVRRVSRSNGRTVFSQSREQEKQDVGQASPIITNTAGEQIVNSPNGMHGRGRENPTHSSRGGKDGLS